MLPHPDKVNAVGKMFARLARNQDSKREIVQGRRRSMHSLLKRRSKQVEKDKKLLAMLTHYI